MSTRQKDNKSTTEKNNPAKIPLLEKLFTDQLKDIYYAEKQLQTVLFELKSASSTEELEDAFEHHKKQTDRHIKRLEKVFASIGATVIGKKCEAMEGLIREAREIVQDTKEGSATRDAALIIAAQKIEHYEIATYGGLLQLAITMDLHPAAMLLEKTLLEEEQTDRDLTMIAETYIHVRAEQEGPYSWQQHEAEEMA